MSQKRFESIKQAYKQALELKLCPYVQINQEDDDTSELIRIITAHISMQQPHLQSS